MSTHLHGCAYITNSWIHSEFSKRAHYIGRRLRQWRWQIPLSSSIQHLCILLSYIQVRNESALDATIHKQGVGQRWGSGGAGDGRSVYTTTATVDGPTTDSLIAKLASAMLTASSSSSDGSGQKNDRIALAAAETGDVSIFLLLSFSFSTYSSFCSSCCSPSYILIPSLNSSLLPFFTSSSSQPPPCSSKPIHPTSTSVFLPALLHPFLTSLRLISASREFLYYILNNLVFALSANVRQCYRRPVRPAALNEWGIGPSFQLYAIFQF